ncbi:Phosphatidylserine decarboxylase [Saliniradius amylolyticus]|uniref:Phosphatidylserine decarboxylase proenzyme n=1 Tax=Saliniradius amylolyticus TaxID=2183582 RepID=A0A2S2E6J9_9ALTE|nr:archaetidylserine decarboxylase [Saliniradius amylolyticus]AWL13229.1 Phosphatidylserine decarboxylase [Saliniradius amylolyticus]
MLPIKVALQYIYPKHLISRLVGKLAAAELGPITTAFIRLFIRHFDVDMSEAQEADPKAYKSFNAFFTRLLKDDARAITQEVNELACPVDGTVSQSGDIDEGRIFQAKGHDYSLETLLGNDKALAESFQDGDFATIYLSPKDYHRIHMPLDGVLTDMIYVPGELFSVNPLTTAHVPGLFARNERVVTVFETPKGKMALVLVGATIVASIETIWAGTVTPPTGKQVHHWTYPNEGPEQITLKKGEEMGLFKLGSTVVAVFEKDMIELDDSMDAGEITRLGQVMGRLKERD